jgi:4-hydroxy-3-polyprenylbenzoate decarboxylase
MPSSARPRARPGGPATGTEGLAPGGHDGRAPSLRLVVGISGASGSIYGIRLLEVLRGRPGIETHLIVSAAAKRTLVDETEYGVRDVEALATRVYDDRDIGAALASGSFRTAGMVIAPCSIKTLAALAGCHADTLIARAGDVTLKEGRPLVVVVRETPLHVGHLRQMLALAEMGGVILPPVPAFYHRPRTIADLVDHTVGRILDRFGLAHGLVAEWTGTGRARAEPRVC